MKMQQWTVGMLLFDQVDLTDIAGPSEVFHHAGYSRRVQKQLRLQEARRLMLGEDLDAASAAYRVGYHDASHFNREYKSLFGVPPMHDVQRLREEAQDHASR
ncbi:MAG TPA: helix-turn-helix domain-containing protein [Ktedonobacteraceae bacterium]